MAATGGAAAEEEGRPSVSSCKPLLTLARPPSAAPIRAMDQHSLVMDSSCRACDRSAGALLGAKSATPMLVPRRRLVMNCSCRCAGVQCSATGDKATQHTQPAEPTLPCSLHTHAQSQRTCMSTTWQKSENVSGCTARTTADPPGVCAIGPVPPPACRAPVVWWAHAEGCTSAGGATCV